MGVEAILPLLDKVRKLSAGSWMARCPAHNDKAPSLHVTEKADGTVLLNCFAGCGGMDVIGALGLDPDVLFPPKVLEDGSRREKPKRQFPVRDVVRALEPQAIEASLLLAKIGGGAVVSKSDRERALFLAERIGALVNYIADR